jgi:hypothetical protein
MEQGLDLVDLGILLPLAGWNVPDQYFGHTGSIVRRLSEAFEH